MKKLNNFCISASLKLNGLKDRVKSKLKEDKGQFAIDNGVAMVIIVAVGAVVLGLLLFYFKGEFANNLKSNISNMFSQS